MYTQSILKTVTCGVGLSAISGCVIHIMVRDNWKTHLQHKNIDSDCWWVNNRRKILLKN